jgi:hypothetical protein
LNQFIVSDILAKALTRDFLMGTSRKSSEHSAPEAALNLAAAPNSWVAVCRNTNHPNGATWQGAKRSNRREAIKDAVSHSKEFAHRAEVIPVPD